MRIYKIQTKVQKEQTKPMTKITGTGGNNLTQIKKTKSSLKN